MSLFKVTITSEQIEDMNTILEKLKGLQSVRSVSLNGDGTYWVSLMVPCGEEGNYRKVIGRYNGKIISITQSPFLQYEGIWQVSFEERDLLFARILK